MRVGMRMEEEEEMWVWRRISSKRKGKGSE